MDEDLAAIVERARNDGLRVDEQHAAFAELVRRYEEAAFGWSLRSLRDPLEAQDATQDAFLTAWLKLRQLREPAAFGGWLRRLIVTQCNRRRRAGREARLEGEQGRFTQARTEEDHRERQRLLAAAMARLTEREHRVVVLFYFLGRTLEEIAAILGIARGTAGRILHGARVAIRRQLPRAIRSEFQSLRPAPQFMRKVREGAFDEYVGVYRFDERPDLVVRIEREGSLLVSSGGGQRSVLASLDDDTLIAAAFDGEGRFQRDRAGRVVQFVYYEFGARLGVAKKSESVTARCAAAPSRACTAARRSRGESRPPR